MRQVWWAARACLSVATVTRWPAACTMTFEPCNLTRRGDRSTVSHQARLGVSAVPLKRMSAWFCARFYRVRAFSGNMQGGSTMMRRGSSESILHAQAHLCLFHLRHMSWPFFCWPCLHAFKKVLVSQPPSRSYNVSMETHTQGQNTKVDL